MQVNFILCASGYIGLPQLDVIVNRDNEERAISDAKDMVEALSVGGKYTSFTLYDCRADIHVMIATFHAVNVTRVEIKDRRPK